MGDPHSVASLLVVGALGHDGRHRVTEPGAAFHGGLEMGPRLIRGDTTLRVSRADSGGSEAESGTRTGMADRERHCAESAESAILGRHVRRVWAVPGTALGMVSWPGGVADRALVRWNYWWQAHLLDCLVDAQLRAPNRQRLRLMNAVTRGLRLRNLGTWTNAYYDDQAWLGLALLRASAVGVPCQRAVEVLAGALGSAARAAPAVALPWRRGDTYRNVPANGPAGLLFARLGRLKPAQTIADWIDAELVDSGSGLVLDGVYDGQSPNRALYTYCQGAVLGLETELALRTGHPRHAARVCRVVAAVQERMTTEGVLHGCGTGDGGLFAGIAARYLALVAADLPGNGPAQRHARAVAGELVRASAHAAWAHRWPTADRPRFGTDWSVPADDPPSDLSVQLSAWMLLEVHWNLFGTDPRSRPSRRNGTVPYRAAKERGSDQQEHDAPLTSES